MSSFYVVLCLHILGATIWARGQTLGFGTVSV